MKDFSTALLIIVLVFALIALGIFIVTHGQRPKDIGENLTNGWYYALTTCVVNIDRENDIVTCEDSNGNLWEFYGVEDWEIGDCASLLMNSRGTEKIQDDTIENVKFSAWTLTR